MPGRIRVTQHVISVKPRGDHGFGVLLGPGPHVHWFLTVDPPRLGAEVTLTGTEASVTPVAWKGRGGTVTFVQDPMLEFAPSAQVARVVSPAWKARAMKMMRRSLYKYQVDGAGWIASQIASNKGAILADEQGLGKSTQTIAALSATRLYPTLLVCPMSIKINWAREFQWAVRPPTITMLSGRSSPIDVADVTIVNYDLLAFREEQLKRIPARTVVFDEAHLVKEPLPSPNHRAAVATRLAMWFGRAILLTGTPIMNQPREIWRLLHMADPVQWPELADFETRYLPRGPTGSLEHKAEFHARVQPIFYRRLKSEVLPDLPPKSRRSILVELDALDMRAYREAEEHFVTWFRQEQVTDSARRAAALAKLTALRRLAANAKMRRVVPDYLSQWFGRPNPPPLVLFAHHAEVLSKLHDLCLRRLRLRVASIGSADSEARRQAAVDAFQAGHAHVFLAPIGCAGVGINLHRAADGLFIERLWTPARMLQAEDRLHRIGTNRPVTITYIDAAGTVDEKLLEVLENKQEIIDHTLDETDSLASVSTTLDSVLAMYRGAA
jgi:SWI/SNF-related matrix-associated actin-dependent regulator 1 of chromatin subfamily A